jgi:probable rRNA maturation factor
MPRAHEQAIEYGHTLLREVCFLVVHGFLHLLGYDHETAEEEATMFGLQEEVLSQLGITR